MAILNTRKKQHRTIDLRDQVVPTSGSEWIEMSALSHDYDVCVTLADALWTRPLNDVRRFGRALGQPSDALLMDILRLKMQARDDGLAGRDERAAVAKLSVRLSLLSTRDLVVLLASVRP
jgi:hypothetical protein